MKTFVFLISCILATTAIDKSEVIMTGQPAVFSVLRVAIFVIAGIALGLLILIMTKFSKLHFDKDDTLAKPLAALAFSYLLLIVFAAMEVLNRVNAPVLTYRTPLAMAAVAIGTPALAVIKRRLTKALIKASESNATVKLTMTDTGKPGADIDLVREAI